MVAKKAKTLSTLKVKNQATKVKKAVKPPAPVITINPTTGLPGGLIKSNKWTKKEHAILKKLNTPPKIQAFVDSLGYDGEDDYFSVRSTLRTRKGHCMGGALLAACALEYHGYGPARICGFDAKNDDSHAVAVYKKNGHWGAVGKSNFTLIRARHPVYKTLRELIMSYFDFYFNTKREPSMVAYSGPFELSKCTALLCETPGLKSNESWKFAEGSIKHDLDAFDIPEITPWIPVRPPGLKQKDLGLAPKHLLQAGLIGANPKGLFKPK
jgi:hypothetical protein